MSQKQRSNPNRHNTSLAQEIDKFFRRDYLPLYPVSHSTSTSTRPPKYYDMHLRHDLRLKKVVIVPDMHQRLISLLDQTVAQADAHRSLTLDDSAIQRWTENQSEILIESEVAKHREMTNEASLVKFYEKYRASFFVKVASGILYPDYLASTELQPPFYWSSKRPSDGADPSKAIPDGFLSTDASRLEQAIYLSRSQREDLDCLIKYDINPFAAWEFKSLLAGPRAIDGIKNLEGTFPWVTCMERTDEYSVASRCKYGTGFQDHRDEKGNLISSGPVEVGFDGEDIHSELIDNPRRAKPIGSLTQRDMHIISDNPISSTSRSSNNNSQKVVKVKIANPTVPSIVDESVEDNKHSVHVTQQGWAEAVHYDITFIIFSYGNVEIIAIRERKSQTLFISPPLKIGSMERGKFLKLQLSVYIAAILDAIERARIMEKKIKIFSSTPIPPNPSPAHKASQGKILRILKESTVISLRLHGLVNDSTCGSSTGDTWFFHRLLHVPLSNGEGTTLLPMALDDTPKDYHTVFLDLETPSFGPRVHPVFLGYQDRRNKPQFIEYYPNPLVLKIARTPKEVDEIKKEYTAYIELAKKCVISVVEAYGLFTCIEETVECTVLLLEYGGKSLSAWLALGNKSIDQHLQANSSYYRQAAKALWKAQYVHKNIIPEHLLLLEPSDGCPTASIISLSACLEMENPSGPRRSEDEKCLSNALRLRKRDTIQIIPRKRRLEEVEE